MEDIIPLIVFMAVVGGMLKNILKKFNESKAGQETDATPSLTRQLRDLLQEGTEEDTPVERQETPELPSRPVSRPVASPVAQTVGRTQPPAPVQRPQPVQTPVQPPVRMPQPQPIARQIQTKIPAVQPKPKPPIQARPVMPTAQLRVTPPAACPKALVARPEQDHIPKAYSKNPNRMSSQKPRRRGRCLTIRLNRKNLGMAVAITEIMNPPLALRIQDMPWDA